MASLLSYALTTVADVKETLGIASSDTTKDNLITRKINQATEMIESYTGRRFKLTNYVEQYDATGTDQLILKQRPIDTAHTFQIGLRDTSLNSGSFDTLDADLSFIDSKAGVVDLNFISSGHWNRYQVSYRAGYSTIPADISEACATLAAYLTDSGTSGTNVKKKQEGSRSTEYFDPKAGATNTSDIFDMLNLTGTLNAYSNNPILPDK
jgi:hypothetical protein